MALGATGLLGLAGCAPEVTPFFREDIARLRTDLVRIEQTIQRAQGEVKADLQRSDRQSAQVLTELQRSVAQIGARLDELGREAGQIQGRVDDVRRRLDVLALQFEVAGAPPTGPAPPSRAAPPPGEATRSSPPGVAAPVPPEAAGRAPGFSPAAGPAAQAIELYQTAYIDYTRGNYHLAIAAFKEFIRRHPGTDLAEKAQYWIGESHFSVARALQTRGEADRAAQEFERAIQEFRRVLIEYPRSDRVPSALYKRALALVELKQPSLAEADLRYLVDQFPSTEEAAKAKDDLARLRQR
ncbi:MAG: tetratricopeptide repeat protein [bacterium]